MNFHSFGPAIGATSPIEALRAGLGAFIGLAVAGLFVLAPAIDLRLGLYLVAPFGASAVLLFAVPNSPLAQPWSAIIGNTVSACVAIAICLLINDPILRIALAVSLAISAMILCRALHPPGGAVAMTAAMSPQAVQELGFMFALTPIALGTIILVSIAIAYGRLTGRHYPFRQFDGPDTAAKHDAKPSERLGLSEAELTEILGRYRQSFNLGVEDLARLIGAAELQAVGHATTPMTAGDIMSHDLTTVHADTPLSDIAALFTRHRFTALPVIDAAGDFLGVIFQIHLIRVAQNDAKGLHIRFRHAMRHLLNQQADTALVAAELMTTDGPRAAIDTPVAALLPLMADGDVDAVPIIRGHTIVGIVTRTDMMSALARISLR